MRRRNPFPGVTRVTDRHGKIRYRFRRRGFTCYLPGEYGDVAFTAAYGKAVKGARPDGKPTTPQAPLGTFEWLIRSYRQSPKFQGLATITRRNLGHEMEWLREAIGDLPFARFEVRHVEALMAQKAGHPTAANKVRKLLSRLFNYAIRLELLTVNPARLAESIPIKSSGYHTWTDAEILKFREHWPSGSKARLALELVLNTGAARQDLARLGWQNIKGDRIHYSRGKSGVTADLPILDDLAAELQRVPGDRLLFLTHTGDRSYIPETLGNWFKDCCAAAGVAHCNLHGLRKAAATRAANAGATENEIAAILAHSTTREASTYTKMANRARLGDSGLAKVQRAKSEQKLSNLRKKLDK